MTDAEKIIREKAVWMVVGEYPSIFKRGVDPEIFKGGQKYLAAIMPIEEEAAGREG
jgi:hypothetical protein